MSSEILMTREGYDNLQKELEELKKVKMPQVVKRIEEAVKLGDLSENAEYHDAKDEQGLVAAKIRELEAKLNKAEIVEKAEGDIVHIGSNLVIIDDDGNERDMEIVDQTQADPAAGKISNESPIGAALIGHKKGDSVSVELPAGTRTYTIKEVK